MPINSVPVRQEITAETLRVLLNNCAALKNIGQEHKKYFEESTPIGTTLQIICPWKPMGRKGQSFQPEPIVQTTVPLTVSYWRGCDWIYNDTDESLFLNMDKYHEMYSRPAGLQLAQLIEGDLLSYMQVTTPNFVGTAGTLPTTTTPYNQAQTTLNKLLAPQADRCIIYTSDYNQNLVLAGQSLFNPQAEISKQYVSGYVGKYAGFDLYVDELLPQYTVGTYAGSPVINGANQSGSSISIRGWNHGSTTLNPGDRITIQNTYACNPQGEHTGYKNLNFQAVVTQTVSDSSGTLTAQIYPPIIPSGQFQNCYVSGVPTGQGPADGATVTVQGSSASTCNTAFAFQKDAFTSVFVKLHTPSNVESAVIGGQELGTNVYLRSLRQWQSSGPYAGYETERMDVIYGFAAQYADYLSCVIYG